jgi:hypothetical protein
MLTYLFIGALGVRLANGIRLESAVVDDRVAHFSSFARRHCKIAVGFDITIKYLHCLDFLALSPVRHRSVDQDSQTHPGIGHWPSLSHIFQEQKTFHYVFPSFVDFMGCISRIGEVIKVEHRSNSCVNGKANPRDKASKKIQAKSAYLL